MLIFGRNLLGLAAATILPKTVAHLGSLSWFGWSFSAMLLAAILASFWLAPQL
jgi:hypothetical protein